MGAGFCVGHTLAPLGVDLPRIVAAVPTERLIVRTRSVDIAFRLADGTYVDIEEVTGDHLADLYTVLLRCSIVADETHRRVRVLVVYTDRVRAAPDTLDAGSARLTVENVYGAKLDGDDTLAALQAHAAAGELQGEDLMALAFLGVMRHRTRPLTAAIAEGLRMAATLPSAREREGCAAALMLLSQRRLTAGELADLAEVFALAAPGMTDVLQRIGREKGRAEGEAKGKAEGLAEGKAEGLAEGKAEAILRVLRRRCGEPTEAVANRVLAERNLALLERWLDTALACPSLEVFTREAFGPEG